MWGKDGVRTTVNGTGGQMPQRIDSSIEVGAPVQQVYDYWKTLENLPQFMKNVEEVSPTGPVTVAASR